MPTRQTLLPSRIPRADARGPRRRGLELRSVLLGLAALSLVGATALWSHHRLRREVERQVADDMQAVLDTAVRGVTTFLEGAERLAGALGEAPVVRAAARGEHRFGEALAPFLQAAKLSGYLVIDARGVVIEASEGLPPAGRPLPPALSWLTALGAAPRVGLPFTSPDGHVRMLVATHIAGTPLILALGIAHAELSAPLLAARAGSTGETYALDDRGLMISSSRFATHLRRAGLIGPDEEDSALKVEIRDPGVDLTSGSAADVRRRDQPLTRAASASIAGNAGVSVEAYRDYRGVPVVGAWAWVPTRGFGVISEVDAAEAFAPLAALERIFGVLLGLIALAVAGTTVATAFAARARGRAARAERDVRRLGEYVVERRLGAGAMGEVYLAHHAFLRRPTALKLLRAQGDDKIAVERFEREVQVTASLTHPNTVAIYDYGSSQDGCFYYAMEFLEGIDLERFVARFGAIPDARVVHILRQVYGSLAEAHSRGLVHRDLKPANLFLCRRGGVPDLVKVLDFGLAKVSDARRMTRGNVMLGTPENMAPELFESADNATARSDIYAVGCVGYTLLTGRHVFEGSSLAELCNAHLSRTPVSPSERLGRAVDPTLEWLLLASLAKDPSRRPRSVEEIVALLEQSPIAHAWTVAQASAFWAEHGDGMAAADAVTKA